MVGEVEYTVIGLIFVVIQLIWEVVKMTAKAAMPAKSILTDKERKHLHTLFDQHQIMDPATGVPLWYTPPQYVEAITGVATTLAVISEKLSALIRELNESAADDKEKQRTIIRRLDEINKGG